METPVFDIEDLVNAGTKLGFCPYYMAKELKQQSDIVFMPYNYILDPRARKALGMLWRKILIYMSNFNFIINIVRKIISLLIECKKVLEQMYITG